MSLRAGAPAYPYESNDEVRFIRAENAAFAEIHSELWDTAQECEDYLAFPTRPADWELMAPVEDDKDEILHKHLGCGHWDACHERPKSPRCRKCKTQDFNVLRAAEREAEHAEGHL